MSVWYIYFNLKYFLIIFINMGKIIITESQLKLIKKTFLIEAVGVPENIMESGKKLFRIVSEFLYNIDSKEEKYSTNINDVDLVVSDIVFDEINLTINVEEDEDFPYEKPVIASLGVGNEFGFDNGILLQINRESTTIDLTINFIGPEEWEPSDLYDEFTKEKVKTTSIMSHEIMHRFNKQKQRTDLIGRGAEYQVYASSGLNFGIPVIDDFMRHSYYIQGVENLVRPPEIATRMIENGITKEQFYEFLTNDETYVELRKIKNFSYEYLIEQLYEQMNRIDALLNHGGVDIDGMDEKTKINFVLRLVYINLVNAKVDIFDKFFYSASEQISNMFGGLFGGTVSKDKDKVRNKFINHVIKYQDREMDFFKDECERFNYESTKLMKKISKIYSLIPDEKEQTNESILNWDLHQKLMEKRYGRRPIRTSYNFKK